MDDVQQRDRPHGAPRRAPEHRPTVWSTSSRTSANPGFWLGHLFQGLYAVLARRDGAAGGRAPAVLERLRAVPGFLDAARATLREPPSVFVDTALGMLGGGGELIVQVVRHARRRGARASGRAAGRGRRGAARRSSGSAPRSATRSSRATIPTPSPSARSSSAAGCITSTRSSPARPSSGATGSHLQEETEAALAELAAELGGRDWRTVVEELRGDAPEPDELLPAYREELDRAHAVRAASGTSSASRRARSRSSPTPRFLVSLVPFAAYEPPPIFLGAQTGQVLRHAARSVAAAGRRMAQQRRGHCRHAIPAMVAHEAYPGHHLQLVRAQELPSQVRRHLWTPVMVEGWALYCEQLMEESGYYDTVEARLFQLVNLLWRAVRVVLDVGLHTRGMTAAGGGASTWWPTCRSSGASAEAEVRRYCAWPTYQLCYAVGRRELLRLREAYQARAGAAFIPSPLPRRAAGLRRAAGVAGPLGHGPE